MSRTTFLNSPRLQYTRMHESSKLHFDVVVVGTFAAPPHLLLWSGVSWRSNDEWTGPEGPEGPEGPQGLALSPQTKHPRAVTLSIPPSQTALTLLRILFFLLGQKLLFFPFYRTSNASQVH